MDRINFVDGFFPGEVHFNGLQDAVEGSDQRLTAAVAGKGIVAGFDLSIAGNTVTISPGTAFDGLGRSVHSDDPITVDLSGVTRPASGQYKWVSVYVAFARNNYGDVYDDNNQRHDLYRDESAAGGLAEGAEGSQSSAARPSVGDNVLVGEILVDATSAFDVFTPSLTRRESVLSAVNLKNRMVVARVSIDEAADKVVTFSELGLVDGSYSVLAQLVGTNNRFVRSLAAEVTATDITLRLYHDNYPYHEPILGAPAIKVGAKKVGEFVVGDRESIAVDLFIRKEELG